MNRCARLRGVARSRAAVALFAAAVTWPHAHTQETDVEEQTNRLADETSPYLQQHARNPVDWYPWGEEAFAKAREEGKPIFLSVGYSACHWCHVMEHESFEDPAVAAVMNELFVNVKVDREERPDVDELYMKAVQATTGSGGWPMSVWMTPEGKPFFGGTYFPPESRFGRPGFVDVCRQMASLWKDERPRVDEVAGNLTEHVRSLVQPSGTTPLGDVGALLGDATAAIVKRADRLHGGFGGAPKFPHPMDLQFLLLRVASAGDDEARAVVEETLHAMASGGVYDQLGGGFHRYSVDAQWRVPHFEKMLYDNAQLAEVYLDGWRVTGEPRFRAVAEEILDYVQREMTSPEGGFYSTQDADSEGEEGTWFAWTPEQFVDVLGDELGALAAEFYGVTAEGNFEHGTSVLYQPTTIEEMARARELSPDALDASLREARRLLTEAREQRERPGRDEKVLLDWNGLMIRAFARAGATWGHAGHLEAAQNAVAFLERTLRIDGGRMVRTTKDGKAHLNANLGDYANYIAGLLALYDATFEPSLLERALDVARITVEDFGDEESGGFFFTADDHEALIARSKDAYDGATPSAPSVHVGNLYRLAELTGDLTWRTHADETVALYGQLLQQAPFAAARMLQGMHFQHVGPRTIVLAAPTRKDAEPMLRVLRERLDPPRVVLLRTDAWAETLMTLTGLVEGRGTVDGKPTAYVCRHFTCSAPITSVEGLVRALTD